MESEKKVVKKSKLRKILTGLLAIGVTLAVGATLSSCEKGSGDVGGGGDVGPTSGLDF